jgi:TM2 domain-containing membrane protein YozV
MTPNPGRFCHGCGQPLLEGAKFCAHCGMTVESTAMVRAAPPASSGPGRDVFCRACGRPINALAPICPGCGAPQSTPGQAGEKSRIAAALLAIFLGGFGVHKFYLARPFQGILCILFCWTFIPAIIGFIEGIAYLCMSDTGFARKYG